MASRSQKGARNYLGIESEQSKTRRKKKKMETAEGLVKGLRQNKQHLPRKGL